MQLTDVCTKCLQEKPIELFPKRGIGKRGHCNLCRSKYMVEWQRNHKEKRKIYQTRWNAKNADRVREVGRIGAARRRKENPEQYNAAYHRAKCKRYGVTVEWYEQKLAEQGGLCAICRNPCKSGRRLAVDHSHETGIARGLLCADCNGALARLESIDGWEHKAMEYLKRF